MKHILSLTLVALFSTTALWAQHKMKSNAERASPHDTVKSKDITITYGRPYKKGRDIFGTLEPYGKVWRLGADEATEITFKKDGTFDGKPIKAGTYTMFAIPNKDNWEIILNSKLGQWGAFGYDKVKDQDVLHVTVPIKHTDEVTEQLTIKPSAKSIDIAWDHTKLKVPVKF